MTDGDGLNRKLVYLSFPLQRRPVSRKEGIVALRSLDRREKYRYNGAIVALNEAPREQQLTVSASFAYRATETPLPAPESHVSWGPWDLV